YFVNCFYGGIDSSIKTDGYICSRNVFVNRSGQSDAGKIILFAEGQRSLEGTVSSNDYHAFYAVFLQLFVSFCTSFRCKKLFASRGLQAGSAPLYNIGYGFGIHLEDIAVYQSPVAVHNAVNFYSIVNARPCNSAYGCVHPRGISTGGKYCNFRNFTHKEFITQIIYVLI